MPQNSWVWGRSMIHFFHAKNRNAPYLQAFWRGGKKGADESISKRTDRKDPATELELGDRCTRGEELRCLGFPTFKTDFLLWPVAQWLEYLPSQLQFWFLFKGIYPVAGLIPSPCLGTCGRQTIDFSPPLPLLSPPLLLSLKIKRKSMEKNKIGFLLLGLECACEGNEASYHSRTSNKATFIIFRGPPLGFIMVLSLLLLPWGVEIVRATYKE